jgi:hypothetical protein
MCIFSGEVVSVSNTRIFGRTEQLLRGPVRASQVLVYKMKFAAPSALAMILPIPILPGSPDDAVEFIDLSRHAAFFDRLDEHFSKPVAKGRGMDLSFSLEKTLEVHQVGDYEASFVPTMRDFGRLDRRFTLPANTWVKLPQYADYGFAVFKLNQNLAPSPTSSPRSRLQVPASKAEARRHENFRAEREAIPSARDVHPMAFKFPTRHPEFVFFPTVHIHDGEVHQYGVFDHELFVQSEELGADLVNGAVTGEPWLMSSSPLSGVGPGNVIDPDRRGYKATLKGELSNVDVILRRGRA